jgi:endonuclease/exonuclease/phosphatase family metal-dependent hydrolase
VLFALLAIAAVVPQTAQAKAKPDVTVMSRNLYLGADVVQLATARDEAELRQKAQQLHATVDRTNFPQRANAIVAEIAATKPDVIGFQEVANYYRGPDGVHDNTVNANIELYNFRKIITQKMKAEGLKYRVVSYRKWLDVEVPSDDGYDLRAQQANMVMVKRTKRIKFLRERGGVFATQLDIPLATQVVKQTRGWAGADLRVAGKKFRFIDPHAEAYCADCATKQFEELLRASNGAKSKKLATIMAGDFNSDPAATDEKAEGYRAVVAAGFKNTGKRTATCCQSETLDNPVSELETWIDHIMVRPAARVLKRQIVGDQPSDMIGGLWPSDHAGVIVKLRLKR